MSNFTKITITAQQQANYTNFPHNQIQALYNLYQSTSGEQWRWRNISNAWNFSNTAANPCLDKWEGIDCACSYRYQPFAQSIDIDDMTSFEVNEMIEMSSGNQFQFDLGNDSCPFEPTLSDSGKKGLSPF
jgi:hypothetical protein